MVVTQLVAAERTCSEFPIIVDRIDSALRRAVERRLRTHLPWNPPLWRTGFRGNFSTMHPRSSGPHRPPTRSRWLATRQTRVHSPPVSPRPTALSTPWCRSQRRLWPRPSMTQPSTWASRSRALQRSSNTASSKPSMLTYVWHCLVPGEMRSWGVERCRRLPVGSGALALSDVFPDPQSP